MTFDEFLKQAWADHGERPEEVARRLEQGYALIESPAGIAPLARILAHVDGEHLGKWAEGVTRLERLRTHPQWRDDGDGATVVRRLVAALRLAGGEASAPGLDAADLAHAHAVAAAALVAGPRLPDAIRHLRDALAAAEGGLPDADPAIRALAAAANNFASALEEKPTRDDDETAVMLDAARAARQYWGRVGGWLEVERAEYMLAKCHLAAGDAKSALDHARQCAAICERNGADAFEGFFAHAMLALVHAALGDATEHAQAKGIALGLHAALPADQKPWCESTLQQMR